MTFILKPKNFLEKGNLLVQKKLNWRNNSMKKKLSLPILGLGVILCLQTISAKTWKMTEVPLFTDWAEQVDPNNVLPQYPRPQMVRQEWQNLNGLWQFQAWKRGDQVPFDKNLEDQILVPFPWESALSGVRKFFPNFKAWYRRTFFIPTDWKHQKVLLHFGSGILAGWCLHRPYR
jgi:hypothetical protein